MQGNSSYFLFNPKINNFPISLSLNKAIMLILKFILWYFGIVILTSIIFLPILKFLNLLPQISIKLSELPLSFKLLVFVPIYEEIIFRLPLKFSKQNLFLSLSSLNFMTFYHTFGITILISISIIIAFIPYLQIIPEFYYEQLDYIWKKYFPIIYYGLAIIFGFIHLYNFNNLVFVQFLLFPLLVSNQIIMGLIFGYVRVTYRNGFIYCVLLHFFINLPLIIAAHI